MNVECSSSVNKLNYILKIKGRMIHMSKRVRLTIIIISVWTLVQTLFHAFWVIYSYLVTVCHIKPTHYDVVFVYLTYNYKESCGAIDLKNDAFFMNSTVPDGDLLFANQTASDTLYHFLKAILQTGKLPQQSNAASRADIYLYLFIYTDVTWVVSSVFLFAGAFFERKRKFMSVLFYGPWMLVCTFVCFLDVVASVHFGLDIIYISSYTTWLKFVGVSNYDDFKSFDDFPSSKFVLTMPSTITVCLFSRVFFVWLINIFCFFIILFLAIPDIFFKDIVRPASRSNQSGGRKLKFDSGEELDLNSSEARIRNWQLFYGAIEANSTMASSSPNCSGPSTSTDHNSNSQSGGGENKPNKKQIEADYDQGAQNREPSTISSVDSGFRRYSDIAYPASTMPTVTTTNKMHALRSQLPWSYISPDGHYVKKNHAYTINPVHKTVHIRDSVIDSSRL